MDLIALYSQSHGRSSDERAILLMRYFITYSLSHRAQHTIHEDLISPFYIQEKIGSSIHLWYTFFTGMHLYFFLVKLIYIFRNINKSKND